jgi:hypothetical protein
MPRQRSLSPDILEAALAGLEAQRQQVEEQMASVRRMLRQRGAGRLVRRAAPILKRIAGAATLPTSSRRRPMSTAARKRIATAQKKRWAEYRRKHGKK